jgi:hypothetical protein
VKHASSADLAALAGQVADLRARILVLERAASPPPLPPAAPPPHRAPRPTPRYVTISQAASDRRWNLFTDWRDLMFRSLEGRRYNRRRGEHPPTSRESFARKQGLSLREFQRWFQATNTHAIGSPQDLRITSRIQAEIDRLTASKSHGTAAFSRS